MSADCRAQADGVLGDEFRSQAAGSGCRRPAARRLESRGPAARAAIAGGVAGGLGGKAVAEAIDPTAEDAYWEENYKTRDYVTNDATYDEYRPAYRYGWESRAQHPDRRYEDVETDLERGWEKAKGTSKLGWEKAKRATRDAWDRVERNVNCKR